MINNFNRYIDEYCNKQINALQSIPSFADEIENIANKMKNCLTNQQTIFWAGNGGSCSQSQHYSAELIARFKNNRPPLSSVSLCSDLTAITSIANDFGYEEIFARQLKALSKKDDIAIFFSTSGISKNILRGIEEAKNNFLHTVLITGAKNKAKLPDTSNLIVVPSEETAIVQQMHDVIGHLLCDFVDNFFSNNQIL